MNAMATVEYLLRQYAKYSAKTEEARKKKDDFECAYYDGKAEMEHEIINERFGMTISETDDEYIAENSVCSVRVRSGVVNCVCIKKDYQLLEKQEPVQEDVFSGEW